ncbi:MAG: hypothetical protein RIB58_05760 [Phycisphaerales bacterium]
MDSAYADLARTLEALEVPGVHAEPDGLSIKASEGGFDIAIGRDGDEHVVTFGELWHEHVDDRDTALELVLIGLTPGYRLVESVRRGSPIRAAVQVAEGERWRVLSQTGLLTSLWPWPRPRQVIRQNTLAEVGQVRRVLEQIHQPLQ